MPLLVRPTAPSARPPAPSARPPAPSARPAAPAPRTAPKSEPAAPLIPKAPALPDDVDVLETNDIETAVRAPRPSARPPVLQLADPEEQTLDEVSLDDEVLETGEFEFIEHEPTR